jgi:hypothetical protein
MPLSGFAYTPWEEAVSFMSLPRIDIFKGLQYNRTNIRPSIRKIAG